MQPVDDVRRNASVAASGSSGSAAYQAASTVTGSIVILWVYNDTSRSALGAILIHFVDNFTGEFLRPSDDVRVVRSLPVAIFVIIIVWRYGPATSARSHRRT